MKRMLAASATKRRLASSLTSARSSDGWASKSKSSNLQGAGKLAKRSRLASRRASVASTSIPSRRSRKAVGPSLSVVARSSSPGRASAAAERRR